MYKLSKYNYILAPNSETSIMFSGVTKKFFLLTRENISHYAKLLNTFQGLESISAKYMPFFMKMVNAGFVVEENVDELELIRKEEKKYIEAREYQSIIIPTYDCNYSCWYCTQKHQQTVFGDLSVKKIVKHIVSYIEQNNILAYRLCWFGGEPLMQKDRVLEISNNLYHYCLQNDIAFNGQITTNGALLDEKLIRQLSSVKIDSYQITIDGCREKHNKTKNKNDSSSSFDLILNNIRMLLELNKSSVVVLRYNYNAEKLKDLGMVEQINEIIPYQLRSRIFVDFQKIWQAKQDEIYLNELYALMSLFAQSGYLLSTNAFFSACYVEKKYFETIYYNGKVDYCDNYASNMARGSIREDGHVSWNSSLTSRMHGNKEYAYCAKCSFYPVCTGECMAKREKRLRLGKEFTCSEKRKQDVEFNILDYCFRCLLNSKYKKI